MNPFSHIRIAACLMAHDENRWIKQTLDGLSRYTKNIYVNLNEPTKHVRRVVTSHASVRRYILTKNTSGKWDRALQRDNILRIADMMRPDMVLFIDADEMFTSDTMADLQTFWNDEQKKTYWCNLLYLWNDRLHQRVDGKFGSDCRVRAFKWDRNINYLPYDEYSCPETYLNLPENSRYYAKEPIIHFGYMNKNDRVRKFKRPDMRQKVFLEKPVLKPLKKIALMLH